jgi:hypothetical protein
MRSAERPTSRCRSARASTSPAAPSAHGSGNGHHQCHFHKPPLLPGVSSSSSSHSSSSRSRSSSCRRHRLQPSSPWMTSERPNGRLRRRFLPSRRWSRVPSVRCSHRLHRPSRHRRRGIHHRRRLHHHHLSLHPSHHHHRHHRQCTHRRRRLSPPTHAGSSHAWACGCAAASGPPPTLVVATRGRVTAPLPPTPIGLEVVAPRPPNHQPIVRYTPHSGSGGSRVSLRRRVARTQAQPAPLPRVKHTRRDSLSMTDPAHLVLLPLLLLPFFSPCTSIPVECSARSGSTVVW